MTKLQERIIAEIKDLTNPSVLNQILEFVQLLHQNTPGRKGNRAAVLALSNSISTEDGAEMNAIISDEFNSIEGDWE